jgi:hypothetical protein
MAELRITTWEKYYFLEGKKSTYISIICKNRCHLRLLCNSSLICTGCFHRSHITPNHYRKITAKGKKMTSLYTHNLLTSDPHPHISNSSILQILSKREIMFLNNVCIHLQMELDTFIKTSRYQVHSHHNKSCSLPDIPRVSLVSTRKHPKDVSPSSHTHPS